MNLLFKRLQHHPKLYSWVHKKHHEWPAPVAIVFVYSTVSEYLMNAIPVSMVRARNAYATVPNLLNFQLTTARDRCCSTRTS